MGQVMGILMALWAFPMAYNHLKTHNMLVMILDLHYKNMKCIQNFVGNSIIVKIIVEYDGNHVSFVIIGVQLLKHASKVNDN
jgi:hypothetical protein